MLAVLNIGDGLKFVTTSDANRGIERMSCNRSDSLSEEYLRFAIPVSLVSSVWGVHEKGK